MSKVLPWLLVLALGASTAYLVSGIQKRDLELVNIRSQVKELQQAQADYEQQVSVAPDSNEFERLRKEAEEVHKLRSEVVRLQRDRQNLEQQLAAKQVGAELVAQEPPPLQNAAITDQGQPEVDDPSTRFQREQASKCMQNMAVIEEAKTMWAVANNKQAGVIPTLAEISIALPNNTMPLCPSGGAYSLNEVGVPVSCSVPGHSLLP